MLLHPLPAGADSHTTKKSITKTTAEDASRRLSLINSHDRKNRRPPPLFFFYAASITSIDKHFNSKRLLPPFSGKLALSQDVCRRFFK